MLDPQALGDMGVSPEVVSRKLSQPAWLNEARLPSEDEKLREVVNVGSGELSIIDVEKGSVIRTVPTGAEPHGVAFNRSAKVVIVSNKGDDSLSVYDRKGTLQQELPLSPQLYHVESTEGDDVWISSRKQGKVWLLSTKDFTLGKTLEIPGIGHQIVFNS